MHSPIHSSINQTRYNASGIIQTEFKLRSDILIKSFSTNPWKALYQAGIIQLETNSIKKGGCAGCEKNDG